jgi:hypothetical protein
MYKINTLEFNGNEHLNDTPPNIPAYHCMALDYDNSDGETEYNYFGNAVTAWEIFRKSCPSSVLAAVRNVHLRFNSEPFKEKLLYVEVPSTSLLERLESVATQSPQIVFEFYPGWKSPDFFRCVEREKSIMGAGIRCSRRIVNCFWKREWD